MAGQNLDADSDFLVKEAKTSNYIFGFLLIIIFMVTAMTSKPSIVTYLSVTTLFLLPGAMFIYKAERNKTIMKINMSGFYYHERLETDWEHFHSAHVSHNEEIVGSISDNFMLMLQYYSPENGRLYRTRIPLTNSQDKAEEEIIAAIDFYYNASRTNDTVYNDSSPYTPYEIQP
jgi:hypothetical protein